MIAAVEGIHPTIDPTAYVAPNATVVGKVTIGAESSIWFGAVLRGDSNVIRIGKRSNIQDNAVVHVDGKNPLVVGDEVVVGHRVILHGCTIGDRVLVGMGSIIMNGARIGSESIVGAGAVVTEGTEVPPRSLILGMPAKIKRSLTDDEVARIRANGRHYVENRLLYKDRV